MKINKKLALSSISALIMPIAMSGQANATTISTTSCVLNIPAKTELVRNESSAYGYYNSKFFTLYEKDLTCPDIANPFKTTDISYTSSAGGSYGSWELELATFDGRRFGGGSASFINESPLGKEYGEKRIEFSLGNGSFKNVNKLYQSFIRTPGIDAILNNDDDVLYPMTFSNGIVNKYRSDVSVKAKKSGSNLKVTVIVDSFDGLSVSIQSDFVTLVCIHRSDKVEKVRKISVNNYSDLQVTT
jgi:hypothetical protein